MTGSLMQFEGVAVILAVIAIIFLFAGYKLLASSSWLTGWLRGNLGIMCVLLTGAFALCIMDIRTYKPMFDDKTVATLSLRETSPQHYDVRLVDATGIEKRYAISGDSWALTANQFRWSKRLSLGLGHGYRFVSITGNYKDSSNAVSKDALSQSRYFDSWKFMNKYASNNFLISTNVIVTPAQSLVDAAMYEVVASGFDLVVRPLNELAKHAQLDGVDTSATTQPNTLEQTAAPEQNISAVPAATIAPEAAAPILDSVPSASQAPATIQ